MTASDPQLPPGTVVLGEIRVDAVIAVSGIGALYRGHSKAADADVLVRAMESDAFVAAADVFAREVLVVRHVEHEGIVAPLDAGVEISRASIVYEPVNGVVLHTQLNKSMPLSEVARITAEVASILDHAHRQPAPLLHGALTPSSVVLCGAARTVRLLDLGVLQALERARMLEGAMWDLVDPGVTAPEQVSRTFPIAPATDIFGLASLAYECLTGRPPFPATNPAEAEALIGAGKRPLARDVRHELNPEVDRLLTKAWSVDPRGRPHDIVTFAATLAAAIMRPPVALEPLDKSFEFEADDDAETVNLPGGKLFDLEETVVRADPPPKPQRAHTLPFGLPKPAQSDPPPPAEKASVPTMIVKEAEPVPEPKRVEPSALLAIAPPPPSREEDVKTVRVVSVTGLFVSLIIAGGAIIAGAFVAAGPLMAQRAASATPSVVAAPPPPPPKEEPTHKAAPPPPSTPAPAPTPEPVVAAVATTTMWPELPKEPGPRPSPKALETMRQKLKAQFEPCLKLQPKPPPGIPWMVHFEFDGPSGQPVLVDVSRPFKGTLHGACMMRASLDARVPPFDSARWAIDLKFGP